jgi:predicted metalloprotease with PDZ domain
MVKANFEVYFQTPGRNYHSLEQSSYNAWVKLYRPDENSKNSSVSYYLKGGLVFAVLHNLFQEKGKSINDLLLALWDDYKQRPEKGISKEGVYSIVRNIGGEEVLNQFSNMVETTQDIDFETSFKKMGLEFKWHESTAPWLGVEWDFIGDRAVIKTVTLDGPAYRGGVNAGDEIVYLNGLRFMKEDAERIDSLVMIDQPYELIITRLGKLERVEVTPLKAPRSLKEITVVDRIKAEKCFKF